MPENRHIELADTIANLEKIANTISAIVHIEIINFDMTEDNNARSVIERLENCLLCVSNAKGYLTSIINGTL